MMEKSLQLTIDEQSISAAEGTTIYHAAKANGISIPTLCFHEYCTANALCRICVVEVEGSRTLVPACIVKVSEGMKVHSNTARVRSARKTILEMLAASVDLSDAPDVLTLMDEYGAQPDRFPGAEKRQPPVIDDNPMYVRDYAKCILCWRCVQVCAQDAQYTFAINFKHRGFNTSIATFYDRQMTESTCVFCGQCVGVCPTGALKPRREWLLEGK
jgi:NADH dehydrogenase/NADH:ubiquinone oxidoreductase subunit G